MMKENFEPALVKELKYEGGFTNRADDYGGPTNQGITLTTLNAFYSQYNYGDLDGDKDVDINDIRLLNTPEEAAPIYRKYYWDKLGLDSFPPGIDFLMFDFGVNSGPKNAVKILQRALNRQMFHLVIDGGLGPKTLVSVDVSDHELLITDILKERDIFYRKIVANDPSQIVFIKGWLNRLANVTVEVREFA